MAFRSASIVVLGVRRVDEWRSVDVPGDTPDSSVRYAVFATNALQLFVLGTAIAAGPNATTVLTVISPLIILIAGAIAGDLYRLREQGLGWRPTAVGYVVGALIAGFLGGLAYWYHRGRKRAEVGTP